MNSLYFFKRPFNKLNTLKWWFLHRFHPKYRFHVLKYSKLKPGWHDVDERMLHACFDLFTSFIENEDGLENLKYQVTYLEKQNSDGSSEFDPANAYGTPKHVYVRNKLVYDSAVELYDWWKSFDEFSLTEDENADQIISDMLFKLILIRGHLWT